MGCSQFFEVGLGLRKQQPRGSKLWLNAYNGEVCVGPHGKARGQRGLHAHGAAEEGDGWWVATSVGMHGCHGGDSATVLSYQTWCRGKEAVPAPKLSLPGCPVLAMLAWRGHLGTGDAVAVPPAVVTAAAGAGWLLLLCWPWLSTCHSILCHRVPARVNKCMLWSE